MVQFHDLIMSLRAKLDSDFAGNIFDELIQRTGIIESYERERTDDADGRIDNIYELKTVIEEFEKRQDQPGLRDFLAETTLKSDQDNIAEDEEGVLLMTLHASKGLEFPVVFLVGLEQNLFPSYRAQDDDGELEEERRLCYVGITRAEKLLYITHAKNRNHFGRFEARIPSVFLSEMDQKLIEVMGERSLASVLRESKPKESSFFDIKTTKKNPYFTQSQSVASPVASTSDRKSFAPGDKVMHKVFGSGMVVTVDAGSNTLTIVFDAHGIKKLDPTIAPLKVIG